MSCWVVDTSPLIFLAKLDRLDLLRQGAGQLLIPPAVLREVQEHPDEASEKIEEVNGSWLEVRPVSQRQTVEVLMADLGIGESEVIALAREVKAERVVMDDLDGRRFARRLGLVPVGTIGLLLAAKMRGELSSLRNEIEELQRGGFRISDTLLHAVLAEAGE